MVAQPFDRNAIIPSLRELNEKKGEFWVDNPWQFSSSGENLSCYERNGVFLNEGGTAFHDFSFLTGADSDGDGRTATSADLNGDGMPEMLVRQAGGGPLLVYENRFPKANWLQVSLRGTDSNRFGVGSKLVCEARGGRICRELYPHVNFLSQDPALVHFGLGKATQVERLTIRWPSGLVQELQDLPVNQHVVIHEGDSTPKLVIPGQGRAPLVGR